MKNKLLLILIIVFTLVINTACLSNGITEEIKSYANPIAEDILRGLNDNDYNKFSNSMSDVMKEALPKDKFEKFSLDVKNLIGNYESMKIAKVQKIKGYIRVFYKAKFSNESKDVVVTIVFGDDNGPQKVAGFFMNSPKLRKLK